MRIVLITQNDVFYLPKSIGHLLAGFPAHSSIVGAVVNDVSPFGKRETMMQKAIKTYRIFGMAFFVYYSLAYLFNKLMAKDVLAVLGENNIPVINVDGNINSDDSLRAIRSYSPDLLISVAGNQIFRQPLIDSVTHGILNLHTALLPKYRGLMPSFWALKNGEDETGVSVFFVDKGIDTGPILVQKKIQIGGMTQEQLIAKTKTLGMDAIIEAVNLLESGKYSLLPNDDKDATYFSFPTREDVIAFRSNGKRLFSWL